MNKSDSPLLYYFQLQYRRGIRTLNDHGIYPWIAILVTILLFYFVSYRLLNGFDFGEYIYLALGLSSATSIADPRRHDFIKMISRPADNRIIRLAEQVIILFPFIIGLLIFEWYWIALGLSLAIIIFSFINKSVVLPFTIPTPFGRRPFEFPRGFRMSLIPLIGSYLLIPIGLSAGNFNLALASIAVIGLISGNYFIQPEPRFYVWMHSKTPQAFLIEKIKTIVLYILLCIAPITIALLVYDSSRCATIMLMGLAAVVFVVMCMLSKYIAYPSEINIAAGFAMGMSILFPPLMLIIVPVFYFKAIKRLDHYLR